MTLPDHFTSFDLGDACENQAASITRVTTPAVQHGDAEGSLPRSDGSNQSAPSGPAGSISSGQKHDGIRNIIRRRADRMTWNNDLQKKRFIDKTLILAKGASYEGR